MHLVWICTVWFKKVDSISYVYISWTIHSMWMIYITLERGDPKFSNTIARALAYRTAVQQRQLRAKWLLCSTRPGASVLAPRSPDITPCDFFLWGFVKEAVYVPSLPTTLNDLKKLYHNCGKLSDARHSSSGVERFQLPLRCYPWGRRGAHWTFINFIVSIIKCNLHRICY